MEVPIMYSWIDCFVGHNSTYLILNRVDSHRRLVSLLLLKFSGFIMIYPMKKY